MSKFFRSWGRIELLGRLTVAALIVTQLGYSGSVRAATSELPVVADEIDLAGWDVEAEPVLSLKRGWKFFPGELVAPSDEARIDYFRSQGFSRFHSTTEIREAKYGTAFGSFKLQAEASNKDLGLGLTAFGSAARVFVNTGDGFQEIGETGTPDRQPQGEEMAPGVYIFPIPGGQGYTRLEVLIQYSCHRAVVGDFKTESRTLVLGPAEALRKKRAQGWLRSSFLIGILVCLGVFHLGMFGLRRGERATLYFAGLCFSFALYLAYSVHLYRKVFGFWSRDVFLFFEPLGAVCPLLIVFFGFFFLHEFFPRARLAAFSRWVTGFVVVSLGILFLGGLRVYGGLFGLTFSIFGGIGLVATTRVIGLVREGEPFAKLTLAALSIFALTGIHDSARVLEFVETPWLSQYGFIGMIAMQAYALAVRNAEAHRLAEKLSENLQGEVEAQTHALQTQTVEADHLRKLAEKQAVELREYDERKTRFFQNISHELRTPLTLMLHPLDAALKNHGDDEDLVVARRNCGRLLRLVNQLLDFQKLSVGTQELKLGPLDAVSFLRVASDYFASSSAHRLLTFSVTVDGESVAKSERRVGVIGELDALEKVVFNYLSNAMKFSPDGGEIELGILVNPTVVRFFVRDTGQGIRDEDQPKLFQIFSQLDDSSTRVHEGTGLGLALCKTLAAQMNGVVGVESTYNEGATFWLELKRTDEDAPTLDDSFRPKDWLMDWADNLPEPGGELEGTGGQEHVLVVDDLGDMRNMIGRILGERGYRVSYAGDGVAALELMEHGIPDLVITDWMMPRMDGLGLVQSLRAEEATEGLPIIMLTAKSDEGSKLEGLGGGADAFLGKPFSELELVSTVHNLMNLKANEKSLEAYSKRLEDALEALKVAELQKVESARLSTIGQLASGLAHELRNPLNVIQGVAETMSDDDQGSAAARLLAQASERADGVVERLIAVSETRPEETECRVGDALSSMSEIVMGDLDAAGISLEIAGDLDLCAMIGRAELSQALVQLVQNAMEASHDHGKIKIETELREDTVVITVEDGGHGIEPEAQLKVFDAFFTTRLGRNASGLGLTIAHRIVHQVDGKVSLVSPKSPTRFEVVLKSA